MNRIYRTKYNCIDGLTNSMPLTAFRSLKKKVGEYQKLTGELPGIWRLAYKCTVDHSYNLKVFFWTKPMSATICHPASQPSCLHLLPFWPPHSCVIKQSDLQKNSFKNLKIFEPMQIQESNSSHLCKILNMLAANIYMLYIYMISQDCTREFCSSWGCWEAFEGDQG